MRLDFTIDYIKRTILSRSSFITNDASIYVYESCLDVIFVVANGTGGCHDDNLRCRQRRQSRTRTVCIQCVYILQCFSNVP